MARRARSLKSLKNELANQEGENRNNNSGGSYYPHWNLPPNGSTTIRILEDPDEDNPLIVYRDYLEHRLHIGDEIVRIPCAKNHGKNNPCPICELSSKMYKAENKEKGKYYYRDAYVVLRALITKDGLSYENEEDSAVGQVKALKFSYQLANKLKAEFGVLDDEDEFWDLEEGIDFKIEKQMQGEYPKYDLGSGFARRPTAIDPEFVANAEGLEALSTLIPEIPSYDEIHALLQKHLRAQSGQEEEDDATESEEDMMAKLNRNRKARSGSPTPATKEPFPPEDDEDESALESLTADDGDDEDDDILSLLGEE